MRITTVLRYLAGNRQAIVEVATNRSALAIGFILVISAGLAREYDQNSLLHKPWLMLVPFGASLALSLLFCGLFYVMRTSSGPRPNFVRAYVSFVSLFWMTAPMAWLYAVPYEQMLSEAAATRANLWTLGIVALWRVTLMTRAVSVLLNVKPWAALMVIMTIADAAALTTLSIAPLPVFNFMGGVALSESDSVIASTAMLVRLFGTMTLPVWFIGAIIALAMGRPDWSAARGQGATEDSASASLRWAAVGAVAVGLALLPMTQPAQALRQRVDDGLRSGRIAEAVALMSQHERGDFPALWTPPPRLAYREANPAADEVLKVVHESGAADWVGAMYSAKLQSQLRQDLTYMHAKSEWSDVAKYMREYEFVDEARENLKGLQMLIVADRSLTEGDRKAIASIIELGRQQTSEGD
ncbi:MAG: hypothetical protein L0219_18400 [Phycisphaerales bacterium]|nr:hypothetical protein [Phycisphaerales bacterium]